jgi:hypothetical protein
MPVDTPTPAASFTAADLVAIKKAKEWFHRFQSGTIDRSQLNQQINAELTDILIQKYKKELSNFGHPNSFIYVRKRPIGAVMTYEFLLTFANGRIIEYIAFDANGKIAGIDFRTFVSE